MRRRVALLLAALGLLVSCSSTASSSPSSGSSKKAGTIAIVTTTTQLTDFARVIGGAHVTVYGVLRANVDPHDYEPSPADIDALANADVIVKNGVGLEKWFDDTIKSADPRGAIVDASTGVKLRGDDPHIWHDPLNATMMVTTIENALEKVDPVHSLDYRRNLAGYKDKLMQLDADIRAQISRLGDKKLVTNHDAFGYYVARFGLDFVGSVIPSFDTSAELSAAEIDDLVTKIKATGTKAIFSESSMPAKTAEAIGSEAGVKVVAGADALYGDTLGPAGSDGDTYLKMELHNTKVIVDALR